ncbi:MAG: glycosyltransferase family 2 protein, partial [Nonlabens sp.]|nr:glycosyltransferase family 2 protein [Nonlabens sp.]
MIILLHHKNATLNTALLDGKKLELINSNTFDQLLELARLRPDSWIAWTDRNRDDSEWIDLKNQATVPYKIMSKGVAPAFLVGAMDYVEDSPFINFSTDSWYPTWLMSAEMGLVHASILIQTKGFKATGNFEYDLNLFTKLAQPQGLFCYSKLTRPRAERNSLAAYKFIAQTKKRRWTLLLLLCHFTYEQRFPFLAFAKACFTKSRSLSLKLESLQNAVVLESDEPFDYDVVIPTMGRAAYLKDVLTDLAAQSIVPQKVIIVEQNGDINASTELSYLKSQSWPFEICHKFINQTGACNARNLALKEAAASWVLLFDDDVRIKTDFAAQASFALKATQAKALTFACLQSNEVENEKAHKQWISFGSGCSIAHNDALE